MMLKTATTLAALALLNLSLPACAQTQRDPRSQVIRYADLDTSQTAGAAALLARIRAAAWAVCGPAPLKREFIAYESYQSCVNQTIHDAVVSLGNPVVAKIYAGEGPSQLVAQDGH